MSRRKPVDELRYGPMRECARCGETAPIAARELCDRCYTAAKVDGTLLDYPRRNVTYADDELLEEYEFLRAGGSGHDAIAARLGYRKPRYLRHRIETLGGELAAGAIRPRGRPAGSGSR